MYESLANINIGFFWRMILVFFRDDIESSSSKFLQKFNEHDDRGLTNYFALFLPFSCQGKFSKLRMCQGVWAIFCYNWLITLLFCNLKANWLCNWQSTTLLYCSGVRPFHTAKNRCAATCIRATVTPNRSLFGKPPGTSLIRHIGFLMVIHWSWWSAGIVDVFQRPWSINILTLLRKLSKWGKNCRPNFYMYMYVYMSSTFYLYIYCRTLNPFPYFYEIL